MVRRLVAVVSIVTLVLLAGFPPVSSLFIAHGATLRAAPNPAWVKWNAATKTATLTIVADYDNTGAGFNFDGYNQGKLTVTVPQGAHVVILFTNKSPLPHSVAITPYAQRNQAGSFPAAFPGSALANAQSGVANLTKPQSVSFVATTVGTYAMVCAVPGHAVAGMWDVFKVAKVAQPSMTLTGAAHHHGHGDAACIDDAMRGGKDGRGRRNGRGCDKQQAAGPHVHRHRLDHAQARGGDRRQGQLLYQESAECLRRCLWLCAGIRLLSRSSHHYSRGQDRGLLIQDPPWLVPGRAVAPPLGSDDHPNLSESLALRRHSPCILSQGRAARCLPRCLP